MKRVLTLVMLLFVLLAACSAHADRYILHSPGRGQLKSEEAVAIAKEYLLSMCPALQDSHMPAARPFSKDYQFGPGWQWEVDTEDDKTWTPDMLYANALFSYKEDWRVSRPEAGEIPAYPIPLWEVELSYYVPGENQARFVAGYMLDEDGNILAERDSETRILK